MDIVTDMRDPALNLKSFKAPPSRGPGSGKAAWVAFAVECSEANNGLTALIDRQSVAIRELQAEVELLKNQIATRKPKGGRPRTDDKKVERIERLLGAGHSRRAIAHECGVSAMTVTRVATRVAARGAIK